MSGVPQIPADVAKNFDRLYRDAEEGNTRAVDNRPLPPAWIDRFKNIYCAAQGYTNVAGLTYMEFRMAFLDTYRQDHDMVAQRVQDLRRDRPDLFSGGNFVELLSEFRKL